MLIRLVLLLLLATPASASITITGGNAPTASRCETTEESCPAPAAIFFSARATTCSTEECNDGTSGFENAEFHRLRYKWTFGDAGAGNWVTGTSKNVDYGPIAAHVFEDESAATYTVTLEVWSGSEGPESTTLTIYVDDPDTVFASNTICIFDSGGSLGAGCPDDTYTDEEDDFDDAVEGALATGCGGGGCLRILFKAGDAFTVNDEADIDTDGPGILGSYGTANDGRAILDATSYSASSQIVEPAEAQTEYWVIREFEIQHLASPDNGNVEASTFIRYDNQSFAFEHTLITKNKQVGGNNFIVMLEASYTDPRTAGIGLFAVENIAASEVYPFFFSTLQGALIGNTIGDSSINTIEHLWRIGTVRWRDMVVSHNLVQCCAALATTVRGQERDYSLPAQFMIFRDNTFEWADFTPGSFAGVSFWPAKDEDDQRIQDIIIENNRFADPLMGLLVKTLTVRNNLFAITEERVSGGGPIYISTGHGGALPADWVDDTMIYNNSGFSPFANDDFIEASGSGSAQSNNCVAVNNLYWTTQAGNAVVDGFENCGASTDTDNLDRSDMPTPAAAYASSTPDIDTASDWYLTGDDAATAVDQGTDLGSHVYDDFEHRVRSGTYDIGAMELDQDAQPSLQGGALSGVRWQ